LSEAPRLDQATIRPGDRWIYSAGFNVGPDLTHTERIDTELADLRRLSDAGARIALLTHQGSANDGTASHLPHIADHLAARLRRPVRYVPGTLGAEHVEAATTLPPGGIALLGNVRLLPGETTCSPHLARHLARLGDRAAIGGFSKAHREHASNCGILRHLPGYATSSLLNEITQLLPWATPAPRRVAVLGGTKPEKTLLGLPLLAPTCDVLIPAGAVLHHVLRALGHPVGRSTLGDQPNACLHAAEQLLTQPHSTRLHLPEHVIIQQPGHPHARTIRLTDAVPPDAAIVDFLLQHWAFQELRHAQQIIIAGPPSHCRRDHRTATDTILTAAPHHKSLLLGGDTTQELTPWHGHTSTGGGAALQVLGGTCTVLQHLHAQRTRCRSTA
jgi:phosphoglycerate kinase